MVRPKPLFYLNVKQLVVGGKRWFLLSSFHTWFFYMSYFNVLYMDGSYIHIADMIYQCFYVGTTIISAHSKNSCANQHLGLGWINFLPE